MPVRGCGGLGCWLSWVVFLAEKVVGIQNLDLKGNPARNCPKGAARSKQFDFDSSIQIVDVVGDWIKIENEAQETCWIMWRMKDRLLVSISLLL